MKKLVITIFIVILILTMIGIFFFQQSYLKKDLVIAAVLMGEEYKLNSEDMLSGISLYLDHVNQTGGIYGQKVKLDIYDDKGDRNTAIKVAMEIAKQNRALVVLGHYFSTTSLAAGKVYLNESIPAITGSATSENVTLENEWYFSVVPNNIFQGEFIASYIYSSLGHKYCSLIYDSDEYGQSLYKSFASKANVLGLDIKNVWHFNTKSSNLSSQMNQIISELRSTPDPGIIFLATHNREGARFVASINYPGSNNQIIGSDAFSTNAFIQELMKYPQEKLKPGYYSDNIYSVTPFLADFINDNNQHFILKYYKKYQKIPTWISACYYDATQMAIKAMQNIDGSEKKRDARILIREELKNNYNLKKSVKGVCGPLFFDEERNAQFPLMVTVYKNQRLIPSFTQYHIQTNVMHDQKAFKKILNNQLKTSGNIIMNSTRNVFAGLHVNKIYHIDIFHGQYQMDFFLWFRFQGEFDDTHIEFLNALEPIALNQAKVEYKEGDIVTRVYHLKGKFKSRLDYTHCPFETHDLTIQFRHLDHTVETTVYIPDTVNESLINDWLQIDKNKVIDISSEWQICDTMLYNGVLSYESSLGIPVKYHLKRPEVYSTCNAVVRIKRANNDYAIKLLSPAAVILLFLLCISFTPLSYTSVYLYSLISIITISGFFFIHSFLFFQLQYFMLAQYVYLSIMIGTCFGFIIVLLTLFISDRKQIKHRLNMISRILIFLIILGMLFGFYMASEKTDSDNRVRHIYKESLK